MNWGKSMSESHELLSDETPATPTEERLGRFMEEALDIAQGGGTIDVAALLADRADLIDRGHRLVKGLKTLRRAEAGSELLDLSGRTIADFRVLRRLGQGGMGQVYLAEQISLGRNAALKILKPEI